MRGGESQTPAFAGRAAIVSGRYTIFHEGVACGEDRWRIESRDDGHAVTGEQVTVPPHPFPSRQEYRVTLDRDWRPLTLEIVWTVRDRTLRALHAAIHGTWRVRIEYEGHVREQEGDFPGFCEVEYGTPLFPAFVLARRDFGLDAEHEFPVLRIGPPLMAVTPDRMRYRCVAHGTYETPYGPVKARRYEAIPPDRPGEAYAFWADEEGFVLESYEGLDTTRPWMKLIALERA